jgi:hypothetical protein
MRVSGGNIAWDICIISAAEFVKGGKGGRISRAI